MLDPTRFNNHQITAPAFRAAPTPTRAALHSSFSMQPYDHSEHDRTAGMIPHWKKTTASPEARLNAAYTGSPLPHTAPPSSLAYSSPGQNPAPKDESFGFFDLLDMINPLQHIPIVSHLYRSLTGDEIKPVSKVIGGTIFGGPAGAAAALANVIVEYETGADMAGNVIALVRDGNAPQWRTRPDIPEQRLNDALYATLQSPSGQAASEQIAYANLPANLQAFTARPYDPPPSPKPPTRYYAAHEEPRMAGTQPRRT